MKPTAFLINVARGTLVNEEALVAGQLGGAGSMPVLSQVVADRACVAATYCQDLEEHKEHCCDPDPPQPPGFSMPMMR